MRRETAYKLAGRHHHHPESLPDDIYKTRILYFANYPPGQLNQAFHALSKLPGVTVLDLCPQEATLVIKYSILEYSQEILESSLQTAGFHLDTALLPKLKRALTYYCERTEQHNLASPQRLIKQSNQVYIQAYDLHLHGDHDDTPLDLRDIK